VNNGEVTEAEQRTSKLVLLVPLVPFVASP
jgi:hypothetical protein